MDVNWIRLLWEGHIPIKISLACDEISTLSAPCPIYVMLPRMGYLSLHLSHIISHFKEHTISSNDPTIWYDTYEIPLQSHLPLGVLFDLYVKKPKEGEAPLPWEWTLHFTNEPKDGWKMKTEELEMYYMQSLKQSFYVKEGSCKKMMTMPEAIQRQLWTAVSMNAFEMFWTAYRTIETSREEMRTIPVRVYIQNEKVMQFPMTPYVKDTEQLKTMHDMLRYLVPDLYTAEGNVSLRIIVQGVPVDGDMAVLDVYEKCCHPDGFLYIVLRD